MCRASCERSRRRIRTRVEGQQTAAASGVFKLADFCMPISPTGSKLFNASEARTASGPAAPQRRCPGAFLCQGCDGGHICAAESGLSSQTRSAGGSLCLATSFPRPRFLRLLTQILPAPGNVASVMRTRRASPIVLGEFANGGRTGHCCTPCACRTLMEMAERSAGGTKNRIAK